MCGYCDDMSQGVEEAFNKAEAAAQKVKLSKKRNCNELVFNKEVQDILNEELNTMLTQLRIHVETLSNEQKELLKNNISTSLVDFLRTPQGIANDVKDILLNNPVENSIEQRINFLDAQLLQRYSSPIVPEKRTNYILSHILSQTPVEGVQKQDYLLDVASIPLISSNKKRTYHNLQKEILVSIEFSGIKDINDTYGHTECDKMVFNTVKQINDLIIKSGIKTDSPLFANNISCYNILIPEKHLNDISKIYEGIAAIDSEFKIAASSTNLTGNMEQAKINSLIHDKSTTSIDIFKTLLDSACSIAREENAKKLSAQKITDTKSIARYISRNLQKIHNSFGQELSLEIIEASLNTVLRLDSSQQQKDENINEQNITLGAKETDSDISR